MDNNMVKSVALEESQPGLSLKLQTAFNSHKLNLRTVHIYQHWITQYLTYFDLENPKRLGASNVKEFLGYIKKTFSLSKAKLNQAKEAINFFYEKVIKQPLFGKETSREQLGHDKADN